MSLVLVGTKHQNLAIRFYIPHMTDQELNPSAGWFELIGVWELFAEQGKLTTTRHLAKIVRSQ